MENGLNACARGYKRLKVHPTFIYSCHSFGRLYKLVLEHLNNQCVWEVISKTCVRVCPWYQNIRRLHKALGASPLELHMPSHVLISWSNTPARFWYITSKVPTADSISTLISSCVVIFNFRISLKLYEDSVFTSFQKLQDFVSNLRNNQLLPFFNETLSVFTAGRWTNGPAGSSPSFTNCSLHFHYLLLYYHKSFTVHLFIFSCVVDF